MKGSIRSIDRKKGTVYRVTVDLPTGPDEDRERRTKSFADWKYDDAEQAAEEWRLMWNYRISNQDYLPRLDISLDTYLSGWSKWSNSLATKTIEKREWAIENHILPELGGIQLQELSQFQIKRLIYQKFDEMEKCSVQILYDVLSQALDDAVADGMIEDNPCDTVDRPSRDDPSFYVVSAAEKAAIFDALIEAVSYIVDGISDDFPNFHHAYAPLQTMFDTGMRLGEVLGLKRKDLDFENKTIDIVRQLKKEDGEWFFDDLKTSGSRRRIDMTPRNKSVLKGYLKTKKAIRESRLDWHHKPVLFVSRTGNYITRSSLRRSFKKAVDRAGIDENIRLQDIRHTHASQYLEIEGVTVEDVRDRLGHNRVRTLLEYYIHSTGSDQSEKLKRFEESYAV